MAPPQRSSRLHRGDERIHNVQHMKSVSSLARIWYIRRTRAYSYTTTAVTHNNFSGSINSKSKTYKLPGQLRVSITTHKPISWRNLRIVYNDRMFPTPLRFTATVATWGCPSPFLCAVALDKVPDTTPTRGRETTVGPPKKCLYYYSSWICAQARRNEAT
jgi:hypothetical protein